MKKRDIIIILIALGLVIAAAAFFSYQFYLKERDIHPQGTGVSAPAKVCDFTGDPFSPPDFKRVRQMMLKQPLLEKIPANGNIRVQFYHYYNDCRKIDNSFRLERGNVDENGAEADIEVLIATAYASRFTESNMCDLIKEAQNKGEMSTLFTVGKTTLLLKYSSLLDYKECFGL
ncbi:hypothetical protein KW805_02220 [Candidatus Pacearchaeota archaeon]|nr:hypothetical protein [Candidatus Pacearchaeota archaeon]